MFKSDSFRKILEEIFFKHGFQLPVAWVWAGVNGAFVTGKIEFSKRDKKITFIILSGKPKKIRLPVNMMLIDARGCAAHILVKGPGEISKVTRCPVDEPLPSAPASGKPDEPIDLSNIKMGQA
jgi:hypothetical protein